MHLCTTAIAFTCTRCTVVDRSLTTGSSPSWQNYRCLVTLGYGGWSSHGNCRLWLTEWVIISQAQIVFHNVSGVCLPIGVESSQLIWWHIQQYYIRSTRLVLPLLYDALGKGDDPDRMKGALYILWNKGIGKCGYANHDNVTKSFLHAAAYALTGIVSFYLMDTTCWF